ncbi:hypothetical protein [Aquimarina longa]|uniref:hypothetical protein n=1 Tax=Aquimarina longa TaxID=1080221 RepID=UPI0007854AAF|nr:hypothetical protein [Aquimarina longa]
MKIIKSLLLILILSSCKNEIKNSDLINEIKNLKNIATIYEIEIDSVGNFLDTLSIRKIKKNREGVEVYKKYKIFVDEESFYETTNYFRDNSELFYSAMKSSEYGLISTFESWYKENKIEKGIFINYKKEEIKDTIFSNYEYHYALNGVLNKLIITSEQNDTILSKELILYNEQEKPIKEFIISDKDTLSKTIYAYNGEVMSKKIIEDFNDKSVDIIKYNDKNFISSEEIYIRNQDSLIQIEQYNFEVNSNGDITKKTLTKYPENIKKTIIYKTPTVP